jgi:hypothetical protein
MIAITATTPTATAGIEKIVVSILIKINNVSVKKYFIKNNYFYISILQDQPQVSKWYFENFKIVII